MNGKFLFQLAVVLMMLGSSTALACEYKDGETRFVDYATCVYGPDQVVVVDLPESSSWQHCIYQVQMFRPEKLLAVTKDKDGKEMLSINDRTKVGNPCYLTKQSCDVALKKFLASAD